MKQPQLYRYSRAKRRRRTGTKLNWAASKSAGVNSGLGSDGPPVTAGLFSHIDLHPDRVTASGVNSLSAIQSLTGPNAALSSAGTPDTNIYDPTRPAYNPNVNGLMTVLSPEVWNSSKAYTIIACVKTAGTTVNRGTGQITLASGSGGSPPIGYMSNLNNADQLTATSGTTVFDATNLEWTLPRAVALSREPGTNLVTGYVHYSDEVAQQTGTTFSSTGDEHGIGKARSALIGWLYEQLIYERVLSEAEIRQMFDYLIAKYPAEVNNPSA